MSNQRAFLISVSVLTLVFLYGIAYNLLPLGVEGEWAWNYKPIQIDVKIIVPLLIFFLFIVKLRHVSLQHQSTPRQIVLALLSLWIIGYCLHMSIFWLNELGFLKLMYITAHPGATGYLTVAARVENMTRFIRNYASIMPHLPPHAQTHPPGLILFFWSILHLGEKMGFLFPTIVHIVKILGIDLAELANANPSLNIGVRCTGLIAGFFLPLVGSATIFPVYYLGRELINGKVGLYAGAISLLSPSLIIFSPTSDQFYPVIAVLIVYFYIVGMRRMTFVPILLSGILFSIGLFFSFAFLVLIPILAFGILLYWYKIRCGESANCINKLFLSKLLLIFGVPLLVLYVSLLLVSHLDMVKVFRSAMIVNTSICMQRSYLRWVFYNLYDFFTFMGIPVTLFFLRLFCGRGVRNILSYNLLILPFVLTLLALDISGITAGEVARTWMFLMPFGVLASLTSFDMEQRDITIFVVMGLQFLQIMIYRICLKVIVL